MAALTTTWRARDLRATGRERHAIVPRLIAGLPLLGIGLAHVFDPAAPMTPLVEAANLPAASLLSPIAVAVEIIAGLLILAGFYARIGAALAVPTMAVAVYVHLVIDVWPNGAGNEPPILLPLAVAACALYVLWRGAGRWSLDAVTSRSRVA
jgi:uncharacterized membrane protein YphA (DoxX/SURF4 family)